MNAGLQTPRLKRLAEIVSAQAIAQQEKMESEMDPQEHHMANGHGFPSPIMEQEA